MPAAYIRLWTLIFLGLLSPLEVTLAQSTTAISDCQNSCSGHGLCSNHPFFICSCDEGWGADSDVAEYKAPDCSLQTCQVEEAGLVFLLLQQQHTTCEMLWKRCLPKRSWGVPMFSTLDWGCL